MEKRENENIEELFKKFVDSKRAEQAAENIRKGEQILQDFTSPLPSEELVLDIKSKIAETLRIKKEISYRRVLLKAISVAAVFFILSVLSVRIFEKASILPEKTIATASITIAWDNDDLTAEDDDISILTAEIEQIRNEFTALKFAENDENGLKVTDELEAEFININSDFWKG